MCVCVCGIRSLYFRVSHPGVFFSHLFLFSFYIGVKLVNGVLVSSAHLSDSVIHVSLLFQILSSLVDYRVPSRVPCVVQ